MSGRRTAVVFGASGFIGRWLVKELLNQGVRTTAVVRSDTSGARLLRWLDEHDGPARPAIVQADLERDDLGWREADAPVATEVYNMAGAYAFGMSTDQARAANVDTARRIVSFAATLPGLVRLVHLSGYRVGGQDPTAVPWTPERVATEHRRLGAYEASKVESDAVVQAYAATLGVPLTIVNPSTVIGDSRSGESSQTLGLATTVLDLLAGRLPALPGGRETFVPVVTVDYLATFTVVLPTSRTPPVALTGSSTTPRLRSLICCSSSAPTTVSRCLACGSPPVYSDDSPPRSQGRIPRPSASCRLIATPPGLPKRSLASTGSRIPTCASRSADGAAISDLIRASR